MRPIVLVHGGGLDHRCWDPLVARFVAEAPRLTTDPVDLAPLRSSMPRTWVRTLGDLIVGADRQLAYAANVGDCPVVDVDAGHMVMGSRPAELAAILTDVSSS